MLDPKVIKDYFKRGMTVSKWWAPEEVPSRRHRTLYHQEKMDVLNILSIAKGKHILDVCTGKGRFAIELAKRGAKVTAIDISKEMLEIACERALEQGIIDRITFEEGDAENLKYPSNFFDSVLCIQSLMHLPNPLYCLRELARVVKPNGVVIVDHENKDLRWRLIVKGKRNYLLWFFRDIYLSIWGLPLRYLQHVTLKRPLNPSILLGITSSEFIDLVKKSGLKVEQLINYGPSHCPAYFMVVALKPVK